MPVTSCATPNAQCWWCGTEFFYFGAHAPKQVGPVDRPGRIFVIAGFEACALSHLPEIRIRHTKHRLLDMAARQSNVAEFTIVHLPERFHRRSTVQISC